MSLQSSKGWLYEQIFQGKIFDTLETLSDILGTSGAAAADARKKTSHRKTRQNTAEPQPAAGVIETEGHTVKER